MTVSLHNSSDFFCFGLKNKKVLEHGNLCLLNIESTETFALHSAALCFMAHQHFSKKAHKSSSTGGIISVVVGWRESISPSLFAVWPGAWHVKAPHSAAKKCWLTHKTANISPFSLFWKYWGGFFCKILWDTRNTSRPAYQARAFKQRQRKLPTWAVAFLWGQNLLYTSFIWVFICSAVLLFNVDIDN